MEIDIVFAAGELTEQKVKGKVAIVIDVLRATSVMVTALKNGAKEIIPVLSAEEAFRLKEKNPEQVILGGEREALPIDGFDYGNSPLDYTADVIRGKSLVMTTSNGTRAIKGSVAADKVLIASFLNAKAIADCITKDEDIVFVCSGSNDLFTIEDSLCAGMLISRLNEKYSVRLTDGAMAMMVMYKTTKDVKKLASQGNHYKLLQKRGFYDDLDFCFVKDHINVVPFYENGSIIIKDLDT